MEAIVPYLIFQRKCNTALDFTVKLWKERCFSANICEAPMDYRRQEDKIMHAMFKAGELTHHGIRRMPGTTAYSWNKCSLSLNFQMLRAIG